MFLSKTNIIENETDEYSSTDGTDMPTQICGSFKKLSKTSSISNTRNHNSITLKKKINIICFHSSPGKSSDFEKIASKLPDLKLTSLVRKDYPDYNCADYTAAANDNSLLLGHSWGCRETLEYFVKHSETINGVILISPYLLKTLKPTFLNKLILSKRGFSRIIYRFLSLTLKLNKSIPSSLKTPHWSNFLLSFSSFCERIEPQVISYASILRTLRELSIPVHCIISKNETDANITQSISMIRKIISQVNIHYLECIQSNPLDIQHSEIASIIKLIISDTKNPLYSSHTANQIHSFAQVREKEQCFWSDYYDYNS